MNLFANSKQFIVFVAISMAVFTINFYLEFKNYEAFKAKQYSFLNSNLLFSNERQGKNGKYYVLQFKSGNYTIYTRAKNLP